MAKKSSVTKFDQRGIVKFVRLVKENGIKVTKAILFGSYARGNETIDSDIDVAIISPQFGKDSLQELLFLRKIALKVDSNIEPVPLSPSDVNDKYSTLANEIKKYGVNINLKAS
jgi:uncharacterized protein